MEPDELVGRPSERQTAFDQGRQWHESLPPAVCLDFFARRAPSMPTWGPARAAVTSSVLSRFSSALVTRLNVR